MPQPGSQIPLSYARQLVKNYKETKLSKGEILTDDTESVWFSKEIILAALGLDANTDTKEITGLRFYLGAYTDKSGFPSNAEYQNKMTLVIAQTSNTKIIDPKHPDDFFYDDNITDNTTQPSYPGSGSVISDKVYNEGQMIPPPPRPSKTGLTNW